MIFSDIIALAKAGYSPADVKELMSLNTDTSCDNSASSEQTVTTHDQSGSGGAEDKKEDPAQDQEKKEPEKKDPEPEIKTEEAAMYKMEIDRLKRSLAEAQKNNVTKDLSDKLSDEDKLNNLFRGFMN